VTNPVPFKIDVLAKARGDSSDTRYPIMMLKFSGPFGFEFDEYRKSSDRPQGPGGIILVSASVDTLTSINSSRQFDTVSSCPGIQGRSSLIQLPSGALLEVVAP
jgi:hypothetical protein